MFGKHSPNMLYNFGLQHLCTSINSLNGKTGIGNKKAVLLRKQLSAKATL